MYRINRLLNPYLSYYKTIVLLLVLPVFLSAGTTGKISGRVVDEKGNPLPGCNIIVEGSAYLGASAGADGYYVIIGVPPGEYTLRASMIGYQSVRKTNVLVSVDLTTTVDFQLKLKVLKASQTVTVVAERPLVVKDLTASSAHITSQQISAMPVETFSEVLDLQAGVVSGHIRGGRGGETLYLIDGIPVTDPYDGSLAVDVENSSIQELQLITGAFNAEYGQAMSGVVNIVTKEPGEKYSAQLSGYLGDYYSTHTRIFRNIDTFEPDALQNLQLTVSGPIWAKKLSFFATMRNYQDQGYLDGVRRFKVDDTFYDAVDPRTGIGGEGRWWVKGIYQGPVDSLWGTIGYAPLNLDSLRSFQARGYRLGTGDSAFVPMSTYRKTSYHVKFTAHLTSTLSMDLNILHDASAFKNWDEMFQYVPDALLNRYKKGGSITLSLRHQFTSKAFYKLGYSRVDYDWLEYKYKDPMEVKRYADLDGDGTLDLINVLSTAQIYSFFTGGIQNNWFHRHSRAEVLKGDFKAQVTRRMEIKTGVEAKLNDIYRRYISFDVQTGDTTGYTLQVYPKEFSAYVQTKLEFKSLILNAGVRYDYFDSDGHLPQDPRDPDVYSPIKPEHRWHDTDNDGHIDDPEPFVDVDSNGVWSPGELYTDIDGDGHYDAGEKTDANLFTLAERKDFWYKPASPKWQISPRLGLGYPISDRGVIHISYGHFFQIPQLQVLFENPEFRLSSGTGAVTSLLGNPDLDAQQTVSYEIGLQQQLTEDIGIDVSYYFRDIRHLVSADKIVLTYDQRKYAQYINRDYANARGITVSLEKRYRGFWMANVDYTYQIAEGNASDPQAAYEARQNNREPEVHLLRLDWDQRHSLNFNVTMGPLNRWGVSVIGRFGSGNPYTPSDEQGNLGTAVINSGNKPATAVVDMKAYYNLSLVGRQLNLYVKINNLFDRLNEYGVYGDTGTAKYTLAELRARQNNAIEAINTLDEYFTHPTWYGAPRRIVVGFSVGF